MSKKSVYDIVTERIIEKLEEGTIPWKKPWLTTKRNFVSKRPYHGVNLILLEKPGEYLTYNQAKKLGAHPKKGSESQLITYYNIKEVETDEKKGDGSGEYRKKKIPILLYYRVFHTDDIEGVESDFNFDDIEVDDPIAEAENIVRLYNDRPRVNEKLSSRAFYRPKDDLVVVPKREQFKSMELFYSTKFHELMHSTGHENRLGRFHSKDVAVFASKDYSYEELVAEIGASMLLSRAGINSEGLIENTSAYVNSWIDALDKDRSMIVKAASRAMKAVEYIMEEKENTKKDRKDNTKEDVLINEKVPAGAV